MYAEVLYVDDSPADVELVRDALAAYPTLVIRTVGDGAEALAYLRRAGVYAMAPRPELILLDLDLPRIDGRLVLAELKSDLTLQTIPVIVLSGSSRAADRALAYELGANAYVVKPTELRTLREVARTIYEFWCEAAAPKRGLSGSG
jgi:CheY-like chemotaxis protein